MHAWALLGAVFKIMNLHYKLSFSFPATATCEDSVGSFCNVMHFLARMTIILNFVTRGPGDCSTWMLAALTVCPSHTRFKGCFR